MKFTWDPKKAAANEKKHGVTFDEAMTVFEDPLGVGKEDELYPDRLVVIGRSTGQRLLFCVYVEPGEELVRIISTRPHMRGETMKKGPDQREPSRASLREMPEVDFSKGKVFRNPYAARIAKEGYQVVIGRGRPKKGEETGPTVPRSVRFPAAVWDELERRAKAEGLTLHAALRKAIAEWVNRPARAGVRP